MVDAASDIAAAITRLNSALWRGGLKPVRAIVLEDFDQATRLEMAMAKNTSTIIDPAQPAKTRQVVGVEVRHD
ncbi:MAG: hypothetical protein AAGA36_00090 [Pseudomonadota bacterium]